MLLFFVLHESVSQQRIRSLTYQGAEMTYVWEYYDPPQGVTHLSYVNGTRDLAYRHYALSIFRNINHIYGWNMTFDYFVKVSNYGVPGSMSIANFQSQDNIIQNSMFTLTINGSIQEHAQLCAALAHRGSKIEMSNNIINISYYANHMGVAVGMFWNATVLLSYNNSILYNISSPNILFGGIISSSKDQTLVVKLTKVLLYHQKIQRGKSLIFQTYSFDYLENMTVFGCVAGISLNSDYVIENCKCEFPSKSRAEDGAVVGRLAGYDCHSSFQAYQLEVYTEMTVKSQQFRSNGYLNLEHFHCFEVASELWCS